MIKTIINYFKNLEHRDRERHIIIAQAIGQFYLEKNNGSYKDATEEIIQLGITQIKVMGNKISITLTRCGLLIGRKGINIDNLQIFLEKYLQNNIQLDIIEDKITGWLIPYNAMEYENYDLYS